MIHTRYPVIEIFGPTIQGEGVHVGHRTWFIRFAGCDYRCDWCDTKYSWPGGQGQQLTKNDILDQIPLAECRRVILTGGNPVLHDLSELILAMQEMGYWIGVETQGSLWKEWMVGVSHVALSPKRGELGDFSEECRHLRQYVARLKGVGVSVEMKCVVFDEEDYTWALYLHHAFGDLPFTLQCGSVDGAPVDLRHWVERFSRDKSWGASARFLPQVHAVIWGNKRGV